MPSYSFIDDEHHWLVFTSIGRRNDPQTCPKCGKPGERAPWLDAPNIDRDSAGSWNAGEFNPGLGKVTYGVKDAERQAKRMGLEPVGNEPPDNLHKAAEKRQQETREQRWRDADRNMLYD